MVSKTPSTLRSQLTRLVAAAVLPVWLVSGFLVFHAYSAKRGQVNDSMMETARSLTMAVDRELAGMQSALQAFATSPGFAAGDFVSLRSQALQLLKSYPAADIIVADKSGQQLINTFRPYGALLPKRQNPDTVQRVFQTGKPVVSDLYFGSVSHRPLIGIDIPVVIDGKVAYDLAMTLPAESLASVLRRQGLPRERYGSIMDSRQLLVARSRDSRRFVGRKANPQLSRALSIASEGFVALDRNLDGVPAFAAICRSELSGWSVVVGVPKAYVLSGIYRWVAWAVAGGACISLFGIALALGYARRIAGAIQALVEPALSIGRGGPVPAVGPHAIKETGEVAAALRQASDLLQSRHGELLESEKRYRVLFSNAGEGIFIMSAQGALLEVNDSFARMHGYSVPEMSGMSIKDLDTVASAQAEPERIRRILAGESLTFEVEHFHRDGRVFTLEVSANQISFGDETYILCLHRDVTERKLAEQKISRLTGLYAALSECSQAIVRCRSEADLFSQICRDAVQLGGLRTAWIGLKDCETGLVRPVASCCQQLEPLRLTEVSACADSPFGHGPTGTAIREGRPVWCQDFLNDPATEPWHDLGRDLDWRASASLPLFKGGETIGSFTMYSSEINAFGEAERSLLVEMSMNVSYALDNFVREAARQEAESALRQSRAFLDGLIEKSPMNMWVSDHKGTLIRANQALRNQFQVSDRELVGIYNIFDDPLVEEQGYMQQVREVFEKGQTARFTICYDTSRIPKLKLENGAQAVLEVTISPVLDARGKVSNAIVQHMDISELKQMEEALNESKLAAESANRAKSEFLANMSHEIRTPMNGIMGMAQLLQYTDPTEDQKEYLNDIMTSSHSLLSLVNDILDLSKIEEGKVELEQRDFSLRSCIDDVVRSQVALIQGKGLVLNTEIAAQVPDWLIGDQFRLKQILLNVFGNAVKFTAKGSIGLVVSVAEFRDGGALLKFAVTDTGIGIAPEALGKIFDPFSQAEASTTRSYGGTGLGLSICTRLSELMGGRVWAKSTEGVGSEFHLLIPFPVSAEADQKKGGDSAPAVWEGPPLNILIADDQETNLKFSRQIFQRRGHAVVTARNGRDALEKWEKGAFDLVLMDVQMPVMNGIAAARAIRARESGSTAHTPIIALTAFALKGDRARMLEQGFDGYVSKPIDIDSLFDEVRKLTA